MASLSRLLLQAAIFYAPEPRWPDKTDGLDPAIDMLLVESYEDGTIERLTNFVDTFPYVKRLEWTPIVAILR